MNNGSRRFYPVILAVAVLIAQEGVPQAEAPDSASGAAIQGVVRWTGPIPKPELLKVPRDSKYCGATIPSEEFLIDPATRGVARVVVSLEGVPSGQPLPPASSANPVRVDNGKCHFVPRVQAAMVGTTLEITTTDPILHNTHSRKRNRFGETHVNVAIPASSPKVIRKPLHEPGLLSIRCDAHPFMQAWIYAFEHPYFAVTDETGRFELPKVPPGTYQMRLWHEALGTREATVTVTSDVPVRMDFELGLGG